MLSPGASSTIAVAAGTAQGRRAAIAWNILGLADFAVATLSAQSLRPARFS
jgi:hypothetical protein